MNEKPNQEERAPSPARRQFLKTTGLVALGPLTIGGAARVPGATPVRSGAADGLGAFSGLDERLWTTSPRSAKRVTWQQVAPGHGGTCWYLRIHPSDPNCEIESCDMGGSYLTLDGSRTYQSVNDPDWTFPRLHYLNGVDFCLAQPLIGYAVSDGNGAFKTLDKGRSWTPLALEALDALYATGRRKRAPLSTVTVDPDNPDEVWIGTGFRRGDESRGTLRLPCGLVHSADGGRTWTHLTNAFPPDAMLRKLCITPAESPGGKVLLAATDRGLYLSRDGGKSWEKRAGKPGQVLPHGQLTDLDTCWDRTQGKLVLVVSLTPEVRPAGEGLEFAGGIFRSEDLGESWQDATGNLRLPTRLILKMPEAQSNRQTSPVDAICLHLLWSEFLADPANRDALAAGAAPPGKSDSFFQRWLLFRRKRQTTVRKEALARVSHTDRILPDFHEVRIDPRDPQVIYTSIHQRIFPFGVWKTRDGGRTWVETVRGAQGWADPDWAVYRPANGPIYNIEQVWTARHPMNWGAPEVRFGLWDVRTFDLSKSNPDVLYFHTHRVTYRSDDGAATWRDACNHVVSGGGFMGNGNSNMCVYGLAFHPRDHERALFWMADCGVKTSRDGGRSLHSMPGASFGSNQWVYSAAFDPDDPDRFYQIFGCHDGLTDHGGTYFLESRDFGRTCEGVTVAEDGGVKLPDKITAFSETVNRLLVDPRSPRERRRFLAAHSVVDRMIGDGDMKSRGSKGVFISDDGGKSWRASNHGLEEATLNITDLVPDPQNFDILYAAMVMRVEGDRIVPGGLYVSRDGAQSWSRLASLPLVNVSQVVAGPEGTLYAAGGYGASSREFDRNGGVYRSTDGGRSWEQLLAAPRISCLAVCPTNPRLIYCTVETRQQMPQVKGAGIWRSANGGRHWQRVNAGLATNFRFTCLQFNPYRRGEVWAGTFGSGFYRASDPDASS